MEESNKKPDSNEIIIKIKATLDKIRPFLKREGGDVEFVSYEEETGVVKIKTLGACNGCILAGDEIIDGVETILEQEVPSVTKVEMEADPSTPSLQKDGSYGFFPGGIPVYPNYMYFEDEDEEDDDDPLSLKAQLEDEKKKKEEEDKGKK